MLDRTDIALLTEVIAASDAYLADAADDADRDARRDIIGQVLAHCMLDQEIHLADSSVDAWESYESQSERVAHAVSYGIVGF